MLSRSALQRLPPCPSPVVEGAADPLLVPSRALAAAPCGALAKPSAAPARCNTTATEDAEDLALQDRCFLTRLGQYSQLHCTRPASLTADPPSQVPLPNPFAPSRLPSSRAETVSLQCLDGTFLEVPALNPPRIGRSSCCRTVFEVHHSPQGALALHVAGRNDVWLSASSEGRLRCVAALDETAQFAPQWDGDVLRLRSRSGQCVMVPITGDRLEPFAALVRATPPPPSGYGPWLLQRSPRWVSSAAKLLDQLVTAVWLVYGAPFSALCARTGPTREVLRLQQALDEALFRGERQEAIALSAQLEALRKALRR